MRVFLHAGHFKTGTTSFQQLLIDNKIDLAERSIYVPEFRNGNHGYRLGINSKTGRNESGLSEELLRARRSGYSVAIVSAEVVSHFGSREYSNLKQIFDGFELSFFLVLRPWQTFLAPRFKQNIKRGDYQTFASYVDQIRRTGDRHPDANYSLIIERALAHFSDVIVLEYETDAASRAILSRVGLDLASIDKMIETTGTMNVSQQWAEVEAYRIFNAIVGSAVGWSADRKATQSLAWTQDIKIFRTSTFVNLVKRNDPGLYQRIADIAGQTQASLSTDLLDEQIERWASVLKKTVTRNGVQSNLSPDFFASGSGIINYLETDIAQIDSSLRFDTLAAYEKFKGQLG